ncbi:hypothetical protein SUGI_0175400 [Cryptomeria japonica]|uniref:probable RNA-dependent RNA polymerase 1 n=1 Tax=Cryptomeria japonica TaxID=3369 RepID=UPI002408D1E5|nr:probable RNA-dependent RNA polymerase 1 [Cryptomeria japonica]GLJ11722.1 hypothetical protein SUGI_0175400 [Cryptomeria japonica]
MSRTVQIQNLPSLRGTEELVKYLENLTGEGSVEVCKLRRSRKSGMCVTVQFQSPAMAAQLCDRPYIMFRSHVLTVKSAKRDIIFKAASKPLQLKGAKLFAGCQFSPIAFHLLWSSRDDEVTVEFGFDVRRVSVYVNEGGFEYKLQLSYADIRYIHLRYVKGKASLKLLLFELHCVPRIYKKEESSSTSREDDVFHDYYKAGHDNQWIRTTDFTPFCSFGQSLAICLELPYNVNVSQIQRDFPRYKEIGDILSFQEGFSYSDSKLVPIVNLSEFHLPYKILFQINSLIQEGILSWPSLTNEFFNFLKPDKKPRAFIDYALTRFKNLRSPCYNPVKLLLKEYNTFRRSRWYNYPSSAGNVGLDGGLMYVHRVHVTPSKVYFFGPEVNVSNRVTRQFANYIDDFLRVTFVDENGDKLYATDLSQQRITMNNGQGKHTKLYSRVLSVLRDGILIADKKFEFLAFSTSQLRESSVWMFASNAEVSAHSIRRWMGNFSSVKNVAKCARRLGQSFSSSTETLHVSDFEIDHIPDICRKQYIFSDGIGKISLSLAEKVAAKCKCDNTPSAFQIRYGGYKGVVAVDPESKYKLSLRQSMLKYRSDDTNLDVLSWSKFRPCFLNRQIISLLSTLGVEDHNFEKLQEKAVEDLDRVLTDQAVALNLLQIMSAGEHHNALISMLSCGFFANSEPYLLMMLNAFRASKLLELRNKTRIFVPKGRCLMGCLDETGTLNYGEVFVQVSHAAGSKQYHDPGLAIFRQSGLDHKKCIVKGKVIVAKNPCLHPGDVRVLVAVDIPKLHHMVDCVVFPQRGQRPHPDECSGSDLDGDLFFISWDKSLIPPQQEPPMDYIAPPQTVLNHEVTIEEIQQYFADYMLNDTMGIIANRHTAFADRDQNMARSKNCLELAKLFSTAVDFPKTGVPAQIPSNLNPEEYPDFMEKEDKPIYESERITGKLYRAVKNIAPKTMHINSFTKEAATKAYDKDLEVEGFENYLWEALQYKNCYDSRLATLMYQYGVMYEAEIVSGNIISLSKHYGIKLGDLRETILLEVKQIRKETRACFQGNIDADIGSNDKHLAKASAWYYVTYHPSYWGHGDYEGRDENNPHFISFPWVIYDKLLQIKRRRRCGLI